jgi:pimeloyl-ACP methyl ester carboxylesterase
MRCVAIALIFVFAAGGCVAAAADPNIAGPTQPTLGPGGSQASHAGVDFARYGSGSAQYWIYEPDQPKPESAPVVIFIHGWSAIDPSIYGAWIDHLVKRGDIVIYPRYQADLSTPLEEFTPTTIAAVRNALGHLSADPGHVQPQLDHIAVVGHSMGGIIAANLAALAARSGLPRIQAVMSVAPGAPDPPSPTTGLHIVNPASIPAGTLLLTVAGDSDDVVGTTDALQIYQESTAVSPADKNYVLVRSDAHGRHGLVADHMAPWASDADYYDAPTPTGPRPAAVLQRLPRRLNAGPPTDDWRNADALNYFGYWKLFDGLCDAAFYGAHREYALGNTPQQRFMGDWSDGTPVVQLQVTTEP